MLEEVEAIEQAINRFKMELLRKMPFYGDIVMRLPFVENKTIQTARTNGRQIEYNPRFLENMSPGERNFVLMHEVFHVLLFHCQRQKVHPAVWNTATDMIVNNMLRSLIYHMRAANIPFETPKVGIFAGVSAGESADNVYDRLLADNKGLGKKSRKVMVRMRPWDKVASEVDAPDDIVLVPADSQIGDIGIAGEDTGLSAPALTRLIREAVLKNRSSMGSYFVPDQIYGLTESKKIKWQSLLRDYFTEELGDEASYTTPERKYIHMDLILPGYSLSEKRIEEIWAFVDSSGSIGKNEMEQFLTQLYRIAKEFQCAFNLCYWDTQVTDVYRRLLKKEDILKSLPRHSGGTDINCVYQWLKKNKVRPDVMLILTDGYFGSLDQSSLIPSLAKKTILVLSGKAHENADMKRIGRIARL